MKKTYKKLLNRIWDSKGSALIMVIICMLLVGIITSVVIVTASSNLKNVMLYKKSSENFYSAEYVLDEFKNYLEDLADASVRVAYENWLTEYSYNTSGEQHEKFKKLFISDYRQRLISSLFNSYIEQIVDGDGNVLTPASIEIKDLSNFIAVPAGTVVEFKGEPYFKPSSDTELILNVKLKYVEADGTESIIDTDLKFSIDPEDFKINTTAGLNKDAAEYSIIADGRLTNAELLCPGESLELMGNVYAGDGFNFRNTGSFAHIYLDSDRVITRNTFRVSNGAKVKIRGTFADYETPGNLTYSDIWAKNILFDTTVGTAPAIEAQAHVYLADDLTLNAKGSYFALTGPACSFYGYGADPNDVAASSAIVVNARGSRVLMDQIDPAQGGKIAVAGKSFISVPIRFGSDVVQGTTLQGESISYKGEQAAYLLPSECIIGIGHNPMTADEFRSMSDDATGKIYTSADIASNSSIKCYVNISKSALNGGVDLGAYVQAGVPVKSFFVNYDDSTTMVYLYLNFRDSESATKYFDKFNEIYPDTVRTRTESLAGTISINPLALDTVGNVTTTSNSTGSAVFYSANRRSSDADMVMDQWDLTTRFNGLSNNLTDTYIGLSTQAYLTDNVVNMSKITNGDILISGHGVNGERIVCDDGLDYFTWKGSTNHYYLYTGHDVTLNCSLTSGIIIATGDVHIRNGSQFVGLIIARGNVYLEGGICMTKADSQNIWYIMDHCPMVRELFEMTNVTAGTGSGGNIIASDIIKIEYENWKKN